jgi:acyl dehydratase
MTQPTASGPGQFDPATFTVVEPRTFEDLKVGDIFRAPSRTLTDAHATAFQAVSADNHPIHYNVEYARSHGHTAPVVHGLQVLAFTAPGATLFPQYIGDVFIAFTSVSCKFLAEVHTGDTLYPQLEIIDLAPHGDAGQVTTPPASCQRHSGTQHGHRSRPVTLKAAPTTTTKNGQALHRLRRAIQCRCRQRDRHPSGLTPPSGAKTTFRITAG